MLRNLRMGIKFLFQKAQRNREMDEELQATWKPPRPTT